MVFHHADFHKVKLSKPFTGNATFTVEVMGEPNRSASIKTTKHTNATTTITKTGDVPKGDVPELMELISTLRGFPSHPDEDIYGLDTRVEFNTFEIQWANDEEDAAGIKEIAGEQKDDFKRVADSIEALARTFAKKDAAI